MTEKKPPLATVILREAALKMTLADPEISDTDQQKVAAADELRSIQEKKELLKNAQATANALLEVLLVLCEPPVDLHPNANFVNDMLGYVKNQPGSSTELQRSLDGRVAIQLREFLWNVLVPNKLSVQQAGTSWKVVFDAEGSSSANPHNDASRLTDAMSSTFSRLQRERQLTQSTSTQALPQAA